MLNKNIDKPDARDIPYKVLFGGELDSNDFPLGVIIRQKQGSFNGTSMACSRFGLTHISNGQNILEHGKKYNQLDAANIWYEAIKSNPEIEKEGDYLQNGLKHFKKKGLISGYSVVNTIDEAKSAINSGRFIYTGSLNGDWKSVKANRLYKVANYKSYGHIFAIVGYNEEGFIGFNSDGVGEFIIPYSLFGTLYTKYAISDKKDKVFSELDEYKNSAKSLGYEEFYNTYLKGKNNRIAQLAFQLVFVGKVNTKELLNLPLN